MNQLSFEIVILKLREELTASITTQTESQTQYTTLQDSYDHTMTTNRLEKAITALELEKAKQDHKTACNTIRSLEAQLNKLTKGKPTALPLTGSEEEDDNLAKLPASAKTTSIPTPITTTTTVKPRGRPLKSRQSLLDTNTWAASSKPKLPPTTQKQPPLATHPTTTIDSDSDSTDSTPARATNRKGKRTRR